MRILKTGNILAFILSIQFLTGCAGSVSKNSNTEPIADSTNTNKQGNTANDNIEEFGIIVKLPVEPDEVVWKEKPDERKLTAVLRFSSENARKIISQAERHKSPEIVTLSTEAWYPAELIAQSELSGTDSLKAKLYAADDFYLSPYLGGTLHHIEGTDYFVLVLFTK